MDSGGNFFAIGVDFGTNSVRSLIVDTAEGREVSSGVFNYESGENGVLLDSRDANLARQNPADYIKGFIVSLGAAVRQAKGKSGFDPWKVIGIGIDTTGSTPLPVNKAGIPLALHREFKDELSAQAWLWKDHASYEEAAQITALAKKTREPYLAKCGGTYSSEWFWSKVLHCRRTSPKVFKAAYSWVEAADFIPGFITGNLNPLKLKRGICAAGHKAMYNDDWGGLPSKKFLARLDPQLAGLRDRLYQRAAPSNQVAGYLSRSMARYTGLPEGIPVAVGAFDAHMGAVGAGIKPGTLVKIIGTSTCDMMVSPQSKKLGVIPGICGIVPGSIIPGMYGIEAGQSAVGDIFAWFTGSLCPQDFCHGDAHQNLSVAAAKLKPGQSGLLALDWNNGNRTVLVDPLLTGLLIGQTLQTTAPEIYRALVEATAFGALTIIRRFEEYGVKVNEVVNCGGIAEKNPFLMQTYADVLGRPMKLSASAQTCALGAAIFGAVVGGAYKSAESAQRKMTRVKKEYFRPNPSAAGVYTGIYKLYRELHDAFGTPEYKGGLFRVMKDLIRLREAARK